MIENKDIPLTQILPPALQPRLEEDDPGIAQLALSIEKQGLISPLAVTPTAEGYQLLAGNRRLKALRKLEWETAPCRVFDAGSELADQITIVENLLRRNLSSIEEAYAFAIYLQRTGGTQEDLAEEISRERTYVARRLALLDLDDHTLSALEEGIITLTQALTLRSVEDVNMRIRLIEHADQYGASSRTMEYWVKSYHDEQRKAAASKTAAAPTTDFIPPREVYMACDRCGSPTTYATLRPAYLCPGCVRTLAAYRASKGGEIQSS